jgi:glutamate formiminotransferase/formiminotetrahydrofolate cyclodeaminase
LQLQKRSTGVSDGELIKIAVKSLGLDDLSKFDPQKSIIEYVLAAKQQGGRLAAMTVKDFVEETASESPAPGGGSIAANLGALGAALGTMVANLSSHKRGWDSRWEEFSDWAEKGKVCHQELVALIDRDTEAFERIMMAWRLPDKSDSEKAAKEEAVQAATLFAIETPFRVMEVSLQSMDVARAMADIGMSASASDAGVAALCARSAVMGAFLNVRINSGDLTDKTAVADFEKRGQAIVESAQTAETEILSIVESKL